MPSDSDRAVARTIVIMAIVAYFAGPWNWQLLLLTAVLLWVSTSVIEILFGDDGQR